MIKINKYEDINKMEQDAKKDFVDRHSPFIHAENVAKKGELFSVTIKMGNEYQHPDDFDHYISQITLFNGQTKLAEASFIAGALGGQGSKGNQTITFNIILDKNAKLVAHSYCTKHGVWESDPFEVKVD